MTLEFTITQASKMRAKRRRIKGERKWRILRLLSIISLIISLTSGTVGILFIPSEKIELISILGILFSVCLVLFFICRSLIANMASHWIDDRLNERIWVEDGRLYQFLYIMDLDTIHNAKYDPKSGRIEFNALGEGIFYNDYQTGVIRERWDLKEDFVAIFYDYTEPSLYEYLKSIGVKFSEETIPFKIRDARI